MKTTIGGDRLGSGNKQEVSMRNYNRSTHDLSYTWRSSMAPGTLVPFMVKLALPGDSWDIKLNMEGLTLPSLGPLFGSYKVQSALNAAALTSQIELTKAQTKKTDAESEKIGGVDTDEGRQNILVGQADVALKKIQEGKIKSEKELNEANKLIAEQLLKSEKFNVEIKRLEKERNEEGFIKGDNIGNVMSGILGLDMNNDDDRNIARGIVGAMIGSQILNNVSGPIKEFFKMAKEALNKPAEVGYKQGYK